MSLDDSRRGIALGEAIAAAYLPRATMEQNIVSVRVETRGSVKHIQVHCGEYDLEVDVPEECLRPPFESLVRTIGHRIELQVFAVWERGMNG